MTTPHTANAGYKPGNKWHVCPRCGFDVREKAMVKDHPTGIKMCKECADQPSRGQK